MNKYDLVIIGAGPGGYSAAIKAANLGMKVAIVDKDKIGGGCVNRGCIPTKVLLHSADIFSTMQSCNEFGVFTDSISFDFGKMQEYKEKSVTRYRDDIIQTFEELKIDFYQGHGCIYPEHVVVVTNQDKVQYLQGGRIIIATGAVPSLPRIEGIDLPGVMNSDQLLDSKKWDYNSIVIIGGGVIGVEFATIFKSLFSQVMIVEMGEHLLGTMDDAVTIELEKELTKKGIHIQCNCVVEKIEKEDGLICQIRNIKTDEVKRVPSSRVLVAVGRKPMIEGLLHNDVELKKDASGRLIVDRNFRTSEECIYAIGDAISDTQLAHVATAQGIYVVEKLAGVEFSTRLEIVPQGIFTALPIVPHCIYTSPEIATVGLSESQALKLGMQVKCGMCNMEDNGKAIITGQEGGFIRLVFETYSNRIVGAQIICARATDMIGEMATAIANGLTADQLLRAMRAHPTYSEGIKVAIEDFKKSIA